MAFVYQLPLSKTRYLPNTCSPSSTWKRKGGPRHYSRLLWHPDKPYAPTWVLAGYQSFSVTRLAEQLLFPYHPCSNCAQYCQAEKIIKAFWEHSRICESSNPRPRLHWYSFLALRCATQFSLLRRQLRLPHRGLKNITALDDVFVHDSDAGQAQKFYKTVLPSVKSCNGREDFMHAVHRFHAFTTVASK